jgi:hypothetical protein
MANTLILPAASSFKESFPIVKDEESFISPNVLCMND